MAATVRKVGRKGAGAARRAKGKKDDALKRQPPTRHWARKPRRIAKPQRVKTDKQITVQMPNKPGQMAKLARILQRANVNMLAMTVSEQSDLSTIRMIVDNRAAARRALDDAGIKYSLRDVLLVNADNAPGGLGDMSAALAKEKINLEYAYASTHPDALQAMIVLAVNNTRKAAKILG